MAKKDPIKEKKDEFLASAGKHLEIRQALGFLQSEDPRPKHQARKDLSAVKLANEYTSLDPNATKITPNNGGPNQSEREQASIYLKAYSLNMSAKVEELMSEQGLLERIVQDADKKVLAGFANRQAIESGEGIQSIIYSGASKEQREYIDALNELSIVNNPSGEHASRMIEEKIKERIEPLIQEVEKNKDFTTREKELKIAVIRIAKGQVSPRSAKSLMDEIVKAAEDKLKSYEAKGITLQSYVASGLKRLAENQDPQMYQAAANTLYHLAK